MPAPTRSAVRANSAKNRARKALALALTLCLGVPLGAAHASDADALDARAADFAVSLANRLVAVVAEAGALAPDTLEEDRDARRARLRRQRELLRWFEDKGRHVGPHNCTTPEDRGNLASFRTTLAGHELLTQPRHRRQRLVRELRTVMDDWAAAFAPALNAMLEDIPDTTTRRAVGRALAAPLAHPLAVRALFFGRRATTTVGAFYAPQARTLVLNLDPVLEDRPGFLDSLEHEVWHHLLPIVTLTDISRNIWWEGFTEALCELWAAHLHRATPALQRVYSPTVQYPVQSALATLFLAVDRGATLGWLAGDAAPEALAHRLLAATAADPLRVALAELVRDGYRFDDHRRAAVQALLHQWDWRETNGEPVDIGFVTEDGRLHAAALNRTFAENPPFFNALVDAYTTVLLQELLAAHRLGLDAALRGLPPNLRRNVATVLDWTSDPRLPLPSR